MNSQRIFALIKMELKRLIREPANLFMMILFPAVLTLVFGLSFSSMPSEIPGESQFNVMVPGLYTYACIFIIMTVAQSFSVDREQGLLERINTTPTSSSEFMGSHLISNSLISVLQVIIVMVLSFVLGFRPETGVLGILFAFTLIFFLSLCSVGLGLITATIAKSPGAATGISFIFILPQMFFGTFIAITPTTEIIASFLPSYYVTDALTSIFNGDPLTSLNILKDLLFISIISIIIVVAGILIHKKFSKV
ncbi:MAG: ABC transporter permease [Candidatus Lokiarchaeota archaeon]|nr:ABC transporter permease [Candidatus Lokiarchaeota archaeon]